MSGARELCEENPEAKIIVVDTLNVSLGEGMFVMKAVQMKEEGKTIDEIAAWLEEHKMEFCVRFTVDDLFHLQRGGRISKTSAVIGSLMNVKPILYVNSDGKLVSLATTRGRKKSLTTIFNDMVESMGKYKDDHDVVCIAHGDAPEDADFLFRLVKENLPHKHIVINYVSLSIGSHSGPGAIGLCFFGEKR